MSNQLPKRLTPLVTVTVMMRAQRTNQQLSPSKSAPMAGAGSNLGSRYDPSRGIYSANLLDESFKQMVTGK